MNADEYVMKWIENVIGKYFENNTPTTEEVEHIIDYLVQTEKKINKMSYDDAKINAKKWSKTLQKKGEHIKEKRSDIKTVLKLKNGFKIVQLIGKNAYKREGYLMRSCVASYYGKNTEIYSLRDKQNMPHCTIEKNNQIKGKGNGNIHPKYIEYVVKFLEWSGMQVRDSEMAHLGYVNVEKILKEEPDIKFTRLFRGKYFYKENFPKVENKDRISLWKVFGLFSFDAKLNIKINFNIQKCINNLQNKLKSIAKKIPSFNEVAMTIYNKVAMTYYNKVAMTDHNEVAMTDHNEVAMTDNNKVAMVNSNKVEAGENNIIAGRKKNVVSVFGKSVVVVENGSKVKGKKGSLIVFYERDDTQDIVSYQAVIIDGIKIIEDTWYCMVEGKIVEVK